MNLKILNPKWMLILLCCVHLMAEFGHFIISVITKSVAHDIHYGKFGCFRKSEESLYSAEFCQSLHSRQTCENDTLADSCTWDYSGKGYQYQLLVGPFFMAIFTCTAIIWGYGADHRNRIVLIFFATLITTFALMANSLVTSFTQLVIFRMLLAFGMAGITPLAPGLIFDTFDEKHRSSAFSFFHWGIYIGYGLTYSVGNFLTNANIFQMGWRATFFICGLPGVILALLIIITLKDPIRKTDGKMSITVMETAHGHACLNLNRAPPTGVQLVPKANELNQTTSIFQNSSDSEEDVLSTGSDNENYDEDQVLIHPTTNPPLLQQQSALKYIWTWELLLLGIAACLRHTAGFTWGYNATLYFQKYYPHYEYTSMWLSWCTVIGGPVGVIFGGFVSDALVSKYGLKSRTFVLASSQLVAAPFSLGVLLSNPPYSFISLFFTFIFGEMWYGVVFAVFMELLPHTIRSTGLAVGIFVMNNVGGNLPILVEPLSKLWGDRTAIAILFPGGYFLSSILFYATFYLLRRNT